MNETKRGGAGRGQGRKRKAADEKLIKRQIYFRPDQLEKLKGKNLSIEMRKLIDFAYDWIEPITPKEYQPKKTERQNHFWRSDNSCLMCGVRREKGAYFSRSGERLETRPECDRNTKF